MTTSKASPQQLQNIGIVAAQLVKSGDTVGLGSGKAALAFVRALGERVRRESLKITGVSTSLLTEQVARDAAIPLATLGQVEDIDITIDGADEVDPLLNLVKGGGGNLTREKVIAAISKQFVIVVGEEKLVPRLGTQFPVFIEVIEFARPVVARRLGAMGGIVTQRMNPDGTVFLTDNGNPYLHAAFSLAAGASPAAAARFNDPHRFDTDIRSLPGVVETGLFVNMATEVIVARFDGTVEHKK